MIMEKVLEGGKLASKNLICYFKECKMRSLKQFSNIKSP